MHKAPLNVAVLGAVILFAPHCALGAATLTLRAVARNGTLLATPTNNLSVAPGDTITAEVAFSGWSTPPFDNLCASGDRGGEPCNSNADCPGSTCSIAGTGLVQTFQATLLGAAGAHSNGADPADTTRLVLPSGWVAPVMFDPCPCDTPPYPICNTQYGCIGPGHTPSQMASSNYNCTASAADLNGGICTGGCCVSGFRSDFIFYGFDNWVGTDLSRIDIRWGGTITTAEAQYSQRCNLGPNAGGSCTSAAQCPDGTCEVDFQSFAGTLNLKVGTQACGTYTFNFLNNIFETFIANGMANPIVALPALQGLTLMTDCDCGDEEHDADGDGIPFCLDCCEGSPQGEPVDSNGCSLSGACRSPSGSCLDGVDQQSCASVNGTYHGNGTTCDSPCTFCHRIANLSQDAENPAKSRFISFAVPPTLACESALRVRLASLHHVNPPYTGGPSIPFTSFEGQVRWIGPPTQYVESTASGLPFYASRLQCSPHYQDWSTVGLLHVSGSAITPSSVYEIESLAASCAGVETTCTAVSAPLTVSTTRWGDVEALYNPPDSSVQPDISDVSALVDKFQNAPGAPIKARGLLAGEPGNPSGEITPAVLSVDVGFSHISACVDAFRGVPYPYTIQACP